jgi:hypothetical protein
MEEAVINIATRKKVDLQRFEKASMVSFLNFKPGSLIKSKIDLNYIKKYHPEVTEFCTILKPGDKIGIIKNSLNRYGHFILQADSCKGLKIKAKVINDFVLENICN